VTIYQLTPSGLQPANRRASTTYFSGAGGLMSSAEDYLQFAQMLLNGGELNGKRLLGPRTIDLMTANHTGDMVNGQFGRSAQGMGFGLSVQVVQDPVAANLRVSKGVRLGRGDWRQLLDRAPRTNHLDLFCPGRIGRRTSTGLRRSRKVRDSRISERKP
jgi:CubicO group peptidase (beta-lactamase class C family)